MLQIVSGKYFKSADLTETVHRGVYYTNYRIWGHEGIRTPIAVLYGSVNSSGPLAINYEITERLERNERPGSLVATTGSDLVNDYSALVSFVLNITCTPDADLARRLVIDERPALGAAALPRNLLPRVFDREIVATVDDEAKLSGFLAKLVALRRADFEGAMRAVRQYVVATQRLSDNSDLAYVLFVTALESLAQGFDAHVETWSDYEERKRLKIDDVLEGAPEELAARLRSTLVDLDHVALRRRFRDFTIAHVEPRFFREEAAGIAVPLTRSLLPQVLDSAYRLRSQYVHNLRPVPRNVTISDLRFDTTHTGEEYVLTFSGLSRLARHVIFNFVDRRTPGEDPDFNYRMALPGIVTMRLSSRYWIGKADSFNVSNGRERLSAHFQELGDAMTASGSALTDIRDVLAKIETLLPGLAKPEQRIPLIALYTSFHLQLPETYHRPNWKAVYDRFEGDFAVPSVESLVLHAIGGTDPPWDLEKSEALRAQYCAQKFSKNGLDVGLVLEAMMTLWIAERRRLEGRADTCRELIALAVDNYPSHVGLRAFEAQCAGGDLPAIDWRAILLLQTSEPAAASDPAAGTN